MAKGSTMNSSISKTQWIYSSVFKMISPIIRVLMGAVTYPQICEILKLAYIQEAEKFIQRKSHGSRITKSELSLLTGIDSRQFPNDISFELVSGNRAISKINGDAERILYPESYILGIWDTETNYLTADHKKSKTIPIFGKQHSFESYVRKYYTRGVTIQTVLSRLIASKNIEMAGVDFVSLKNRYYIPIKSDYEDLLKIGLNHITYLSNTVAHNLLEGDDQIHFQRCYRSHNTSRENFTTMSKEVSRICSDQMKQSEKLIVDFEESEPKSGHNFCGVGYYYFEIIDSAN